MDRQFPNWLLPILIALLLGGWWLVKRSNSETQQQLSCAFFQRPASAPIKTLSDKVLPKRFWMQGALKPTTQAGMFAFEGSTFAGQGQATTSGNVWLSKSGNVDGIAVWASHADFGSENLSVATLNSDGYLDSDASTAYLFINPPEKLNHPADYMCRVSAVS